MDYATLNEYISPLNMLLIVLVVVGAWAVVELALTLRKARKAVDEISHTANDTIEQIQPIIATLDGAMDDLQPTLKEVQPLVEKVEIAVDEANVSLSKVNDILGDVSDVSGTASSVTNSVKNAAGAAASGVAGIVGRIAGTPKSAPVALTEGQEMQREARETASAPSFDEHATGSGYVTYGSGTVVAEESPAAAARPVADNNGERPKKRRRKPVSVPEVDASSADGTSKSHGDGKSRSRKRARPKRPAAASDDRAQE